MVSQSCYRCRKKVSALTKKGLQEKIDKEFIICSDVISYLCSSCKKEVDKENEINVMIKRLQELGTPHNINELKVIIDFTVNTLKVSKFLYIVYFDLINNIKDDLFEYVVFLLKEEVLLNIQNLNKIKKLFSKSKSDVQSVIEYRLEEKQDLSYTIKYIILKYKSEVSQLSSEIKNLNKERFEAELKMLAELMYTTYVFVDFFY